MSQLKFLGLTTDELAKALGVSPFTIYTYREKQLIPFYKVGGLVRYKLSEVKEALEKCRVPARP
jgi:excisionase family DNA binding protein